jgi:hypothetical protein
MLPGYLSSPPCEPEAAGPVRPSVSEPRVNSRVTALNICALAGLTVDRQVVVNAWLETSVREIPAVETRRIVTRLASFSPQTPDCRRPGNAAHANPVVWHCPVPRPTPRQALP